LFQFFWTDSVNLYRRQSLKNQSKKLKLILTGSCLALTANVLELKKMSSDSELRRMEIAIKYKNARTGGFQGCSNFGNGCDFNGFYLAQYSPEGLCNNCELKQFPNRYRGCLFCGRAIQYGLICHPCQDGFKKWAFDLFYTEGVNSNHLELGIFVFVRMEMRDSHQYQQKVRQRCPIKVFELAGLRHKWPGFYAGQDQWVKPDPNELREKIDITDLIWENKSDVIERELKKIGISIYDEIQYISINS
jgi:hypothetical protein